MTDLDTTPASIPTLSVPPPPPAAGTGTVSRRGFLTAGAAAGGGLLIGFNLPSRADAAMRFGAGPFSGAGVGSGATTTAGPSPLVTTTATVNSWIVIGTDESITVYIGSADMGQGVLTALPQIVAEELKVDWSAVNGVHAPANPIFGNPGFGMQATGGSMSIRGYFDPLLLVGAAAREMLVQAAASKWGVPVAGLVAAHGAVTQTSTGRRFTYGQLAPAAALLTPPTSPTLTAPSSYALIGQPLPRVDLPAKVTGKAVYGIDVKVPGMLYASVKHCPSIGGTVKVIPPAPAGTIAVVDLGNAVAVVADTYAKAFKAAAALNVTWSIPASSRALDDQAIATKARSLMTKPGALLFPAESDGDVTGGMAAAATRLNLTYSVPYLAHATLEPMNCTASVTATSCDLWAPTQAAALAVFTAAGITGLPLSQITCTTTLLGSGLGRKFEQDYIAQAVRVSKAVGSPVKLIWPRKEDFSHDQYRPMAIMNIKAGLSATGAVTAFTDRIVSPSILFQRGWTTGYDNQATDGATALPYAFGSRLIEYVRHPAALPVGFWRSVGHSFNCFGVESSMDEMALAAGIDPLAFRLGLCTANARATGVLQAVATLSGWSTPPPAGHARGIALSDAFGSMAAQVVEVSAPTATTIKVHNVWCAIDVGRVVNPRIVTQQMESGIIHGLNAALWGKMTFQNGVASPFNFDDYRMLRMKDMPHIEVQVLASGGFTGGAGEPGTPPIAPAVANAWFALTGARKRSLPLF